MCRKLLLLISVFMAFNHVSSFGQCTDCSLTISGVHSFPVVVLPGTKVCVLAGGELSGELSVNGGEVCNNGLISSDHIAMTAGEFYNQGAIETEDFAITEGNLQNSGLITVADFGVAGTAIEIGNNGTMELMDFSLASVGVGEAPELINTGRIKVNNFLINDSSTVENNGDIEVVNDFENGASAQFTNNGFLSIGHDFVNAGTLFTKCIVEIENDFVNSGELNGPEEGCGGFNVENNSVNSGAFAMDDSFLDFCDQSGAEMFDVNTGTIGMNVTFCSCENTCSSVLNISKNALINYQIRPNPMDDWTVSRIENSLGKPYTVEVMDVQGQVVKTLVSYTNTLLLTNEQWHSGMYFFRLSNSDNQQAVGKFIVN